MGTDTSPHRRGNRNSHTKSVLRQRKGMAPLEHAVRLIYRVCCLAGSAAIIDEAREVTGGSRFRTAIRRHDNAVLYDWLVEALSYQGISDRVAFDYIERHGSLTWHDLEADLAKGVSCPKLQSYWSFYDCRYEKGSGTCAEPDHITQCPLPLYNLRNGRLNQTGYALYLFIRDLTDGDLIGWIDRQLDAVSDEAPDRLGLAREALIGPLRNIYGVSDKVLAMTLSCILLGAPSERQAWIEVGGSMIAIDTLVHNFMHRTGILHRFNASHAYGEQCYQPGCCADIVREVAARIDARQFNQQFPRTFPRFVQHAIWRYCAQQGLAVCNGNRIDDRQSCRNIYCQIYSICDRISLYKQ